ncbi:MAG: hypothetical protein SGBAC_006961, partial [Bacillariaceae sp.]
MTANPLISYSSILLCLLMISTSNAQGDNNDLTSSSSPTTVAPSTNPTIFLSQNPTAAPTFTTSLEPTAKSKNPIDSPVSTSPPTSFITPLQTSEECANTPEWSVDIWWYSKCNWTIVKLPCDDYRVACYEDAFDHCCKCKDQCEGECNGPIPTAAPTTPDDPFAADCSRGVYNDDDFGEKEVSSTAVQILAVLALIGIGGCAKMLFDHQCRNIAARREVQRTMTARRQQVTENNTSSPGLAEEERNHARYEAFVTGFLFQTVLPDKSNITASSLRRDPAIRPDEEHSSAAHNHDDDNDASEVGKRHVSL